MAKQRRKMKSRKPPSKDREFSGGGDKDDELDGEVWRASPDEKKPTVHTTLKLGPDRKLTKKQTESLRDWRGNNRANKLDDYVHGLTMEARKTSGHRSVLLGSETKNLVIGIPCPALAFEFVIQQNCFPLGVITHLNAPWGSAKSGLLYEFGRWFYLASGLTILNENETKFSPEWCESTMGSEAFERLILNRCESIEDWQQALTNDILANKRAMDGTKEEPGPGRTIPVLYGTDSIMGKLSQETQEKILDAGYAGRGHPVEALCITRYMQTMPQMLDGWPFAVVLVNHLKFKRDEMGNEERSTAGGKAVNFLETFELEMGKTGDGGGLIETQDFDGLRVRITCRKNSLGNTGRSIRTRVIWWEEEDPATGNFHQKTVWDWDWSIVDLLQSILFTDKGSRNVRLRKHLKDVDFHLKIGTRGDADNTCWSSTLGMKEKESLSWSEVGAMIRQNPEVTKLLRRALRIKERPLLAGDYLHNIAEASEDLP